MEFKIKLGQFVRAVRQSKGMTQEELSLKVFDKPNFSYINMLENGKLKGISDMTIDKLLEALNCDIEFRELS